MSVRRRKRRVILVLAAVVVGLSDAPDLALIAGAVGGILTGIAGWLRGRREESRSDLTTLLQAYHGIVANLQADLARIREERDTERAYWHGRLKEWEAERATLAARIRELEDRGRGARRNSR